MVVIADTVFSSRVLWPSEKIFMNANRIGALKLPTGQNLSLMFYCFLSDDVANKLAVISNSLVCNVCVFHAMVTSAMMHPELSLRDTCLNHEQGQKEVNPGNPGPSVLLTV